MSDALYLAALAVAAFDNLEVVGTRPPLIRTADFTSGGVLDSQGRRWVVKCPHNSPAATQIEAEGALAHFLLEELRAGRLPFDIIRPAGFAQVDEGRAVVYPEPFGKPVAWERLGEAQARELGRVVASIHLLQPSVVANAGLPVYTAAEWRARLDAELSNIDAARQLPVVLVHRWRKVLANDELWAFEPRMTHGDVDAENILWSSTGVSTVIGFGDACVGDPAVDLASLMVLDDEPYEAVIDSYEKAMGVQIDDATFTRMQFMSEFALARWLMHGVATRNSSVEEEAFAMLDDLVEQIKDDPDEGGPVWDVTPDA